MCAVHAGNWQGLKTGLIQNQYGGFDGGNAVRWQHLYVSRHESSMLWTQLCVCAKRRDGHNNSLTVHDLKTRAAARKRATGARG